MNPDPDKRLSLQTISAHPWSHPPPPPTHAPASLLLPPLVTPASPFLPHRHAPPLFYSLVSKRGYACILETRDLNPQHYSRCQKEGVPLSKLLSLVKDKVCLPPHTPPLVSLFLAHTRGCAALEAPLARQDKVLTHVSAQKTTGNTFEPELDPFLQFVLRNVTSLPGYPGKP